MVFVLRFERFLMAQNFSINHLWHRLSNSIRGTSYSTTDNNDEKRIITVNKGPQTTKYISNQISTSKYSILTFLPKFLFEQFRKYSNIFFLCIVVFQVNICIKFYFIENKNHFSKFPVYHRRVDIQQRFHYQLFLCLLL